jgi:hypothetical protein
VAGSGGHGSEEQEIQVPLEDLSAHYLGMLCLALLGVKDSPLGDPLPDPLPCGERGLGRTPGKAASLTTEGG